MLINLLLTFSFQMHCSALKITFVLFKLFYLIPHSLSLCFPLNLKAYFLILASLLRFPLARIRFSLLLCVVKFVLY